MPHGLAAIGDFAQWIRPTFIYWRLRRPVVEKKQFEGRVRRQTFRAALKKNVIVEVAHRGTAHFSLRRLSDVIYA